jgi:hypothetical protein
MNIGNSLAASAELSPDGQKYRKRQLYRHQESGKYSANSSTVQQKHIPKSTMLIYIYMLGKFITRK